MVAQRHVRRRRRRVRAERHVPRRRDAEQHGGVPVLVPGRDGRRRVRRRRRVLWLYHRIQEEQKCSLHSCRGVGRRHSDHRRARGVPSAPPTIRRLPLRLGDASPLGGGVLERRARVHVPRGVPRHQRLLPHAPPRHRRLRHRLRRQAPGPVVGGSERRCNDPDPRRHQAAAPPRPPRRRRRRRRRPRAAERDPARLLRPPPQPGPPPRLLPRPRRAHPRLRVRPQRHALPPPPSPRHLLHQRAPQQPPVAGPARRGGGDGGGDRAPPRVPHLPPRRQVQHLRPKLADFGLSRSGHLGDGDGDARSYVSTAPQGTPGYVDPEYHQSFHLSDKSDVYSFGVVLLELVTAMKVVDFARPPAEVNLASLGIDRIAKGKVNEIVDPVILLGPGGEGAEWVMESVRRVSELAFRCLAFHKDVRPCMSEVAAELGRVMDAAPPGPGSADGSGLADSAVATKKAASPVSVHEVWVSDRSSLSTNDSAVMPRFL